MSKQPDSAVTPFSVIEAEPREDVIEKCQKVLAMAEAGDLVGVLVIGEVRGGEFYCSGTYENGHLVMGFLADMLMRVQEGMRLSEEDA